MSSRRMPPVGMTRSVGRTASTDRRNCGPPTCAGKSLARPRVPASTSSATVIPPSTNGVVPVDVADGRHRAGRHDEVGAEIDRGPRRLRVEHGPDADDAVGVLGADAAQRVLPAARRRRELDDVEPAFEAVGGGAHGRRAHRATGVPARSAPRRSGARPRCGRSSAFPSRAGRRANLHRSWRSAAAPGPPAGRDRRWRRARWRRRRGRCAAPVRRRRRWRAPTGSRRRRRRRRRPARRRRRRAPTRRRGRRHGRRSPLVRRP